LAEHKIELSDNTPVVGPTYRIPQSLQRPFEDEINRLVEEGVLIECQSEYRSPVIPLRKSDGSLRIVNNFKMLNDKTKDDVYPMSNSKEIIEKAAGRRYISKLDLQKSYLQVSLSKDDWHKTEFSSFMGTHCWCRMAMGLKNSPRTMQRMMDEMLKHTSRYASSMQDDVVIFSNSWQEHLIHLREILERLRAANLTASITKSEFVMKSLTVWGGVSKTG